VQIAACAWIVGWVVRIEVPERSIPIRIEAALDPGEIADACSMRQILRQRPDPREQQEQVAVAGGERKAKRHRVWRRSSPHYGGIKL
jgi:hypothetical protein